VGIFLLLLGVISSFMGFKNGNQLWSISIRMVLLPYALYWGISWATINSANLANIFEHVRTPIKLISLMIFFGLLGGHLIFIAFPLCIAGICVAIYEKRITFFIIMLLGALSVFGYNKTFTQEVCMLLVLLLFFVKRYWKRSLVMLKFLPFLISLVVISYVNNIDEAKIFGSTQQLVSRNQGDRSFSLERFSEKLDGDRSPLWKASLEEIIVRHELLKPSGTPLYLPVFLSEANVYWQNGAHSALFETVNQLGLIGGIIISLIVFQILYILAVRLRGAEDFREIAVLIYAFSLIFVAFLTGNFLVYERVGPIIWAMAGIVISSSYYKGKRIYE